MWCFFRLSGAVGVLFLLAGVFPGGSRLPEHSRWLYEVGLGLLLIGVTGLWTKSRTPSQDELLALVRRWRRSQRPAPSRAEVLRMTARWQSGLALPPPEFEAGAPPLAPASPGEEMAPAIIAAMDAYVEEHPETTQADAMVGLAIALEGVGRGDRSQSPG